MTSRSTTPCSCAGAWLRLRSRASCPAATSPVLPPHRRPRPGRRRLARPRRQHRLRNAGRTRPPVPRARAAGRLSRGARCAAPPVLALGGWPGQPLRGRREFRAAQPASAKRRMSRPDAGFGVNSVDLRGIRAPAAATAATAATGVGRSRTAVAADSCGRRQTPPRRCARIRPCPPCPRGPTPARPSRDAAP